MINTIKFEIYKLVKEPFFKVVLGIILIVNFVMFTGIEVTPEGIVQKSFLMTIIVSLYVAYYVGNEFENRRMIYSILSGIGRIKILLSKLIITIIISEILTLIFPCIEVIIQSDWSFDLKFVILFCYAILGMFLGTLGLFMACLFKNSGVAIVGTIVFNMLSLFLMNNAAIGFFAMRIFPVGIVKLVIEGADQIYSFLILVWVAILFAGSVLAIRHTDI